MGQEEVKVPRTTAVDGHVGVLDAFALQADLKRSRRNQLGSASDPPS